MKASLNRFLPGAYRRFAWLAGLMLAAPPLPAAPLTGGSYAVIGAPTGGGGNSSGGNYALAGWLASTGAGTSTGQEFELTCGLFSLYGVPVGDVALKVQVTADGRARIWWPAGIPGYQLEYASSIGPGANWQEVFPMPVDHNYFVPPDQSARFFRLRRP